MKTVISKVSRGYTADFVKKEWKEFGKRESGKLKEIYDPRRKEKGANERG
jgi:hypothetical protein